MVFGSVFSRLESVNITTAEGDTIKFRNDLISRIGFKILGLPHIGIRLRARKIIPQIAGGDSMLDAGFGSGIYSFSLAKKMNRIEAVDISPKKVQQARGVNVFENINFDRGDLCRLKFKDGSFEVIICSDVLEHIKNDNGAVAELSRVLKKKGVILLTVPAYSPSNLLAYKKYGHERAGYRKEDIERLCKNNGLSLIKSEGYSSKLTEFFSGINYNLTKNKIILGICFYPLYLLSILSDSLFRDYNGLFCILKK